MHEEGALPGRRWGHWAFRSPSENLDTLHLLGGLGVQVNATGSPSAGDAKAATQLTLLSGPVRKLRCNAYAPSVTPWRDRSHPGHELIETMVFCTWSVGPVEKFQPRSFFSAAFFESDKTAVVTGGECLLFAERYPPVPDMEWDVESKRWVDPTKVKKKPPKPPKPSPAQKKQKKFKSVAILKGILV